MDNTSAVTPTAEAAKIIAETTACASALLEIMRCQNEAVLGYCQALIKQSLQTVAALQPGQDGATLPSVQPLAQLQQEKMQALKQASGAQDQVAPPPDTAPHPAAPETAAPSPAGSDARSLQYFVRNAEILCGNAVAVQQQLNTVALAATTQAIATIFEQAQKK